MRCAPVLISGPCPPAAGRARGKLDHAGAQRQIAEIKCVDGGGAGDEVARFGWKPHDDDRQSTRMRRFFVFGERRSADGGRQAFPPNAWPQLNIGHDAARLDITRSNRICPHDERCHARRACQPSDCSTPVILGVGPFVCARLLRDTVMYPHAHGGAVDFSRSPPRNARARP